MNVLISSGFRWWNAEAAYAARLAELLRAAGHGAWVIAPGGTANAEALARRGIEPLSDLHPPRNLLRWPACAARLAALQRERRIDVVDVFNSAEFPLHAWAARRGPDIRLIRTRGGAQPESAHPLNRWLYGAACDGVIASCALIQNRLEHRLGLGPGHVRTVYYPAPSEPAPAAEARRAAHARLLTEFGLPASTFAIGVVGRIAPEKGHDHLIEALPLVLSERPDAVLWIANKAEPGEAAHRERLQRHIAKLGLEKAVRWLGFRADLREVMAACDLGVIPSVDSEMNCRVAVEFFSVGTPVVAFPTGALPEVVDHGVSGLVTATREPATLAESILMLVRNPALRERLGRGAREQAEGRFSPSNFLELTLAVYEAAATRKFRNR